VAVDQNSTSVAPEAEAVSPIENEIPTYRAISPGAIVSVVAGTLSILSFTSPFFLWFAALAVVLGVLTDRKIKRYGDVLTGRGIAQAGIAMGLVFGLSSFTSTTVQSMMRSREATKFAKRYLEVLKKGTYEDVMFYNIQPVQRKGKTSAEVYEKFKAGMQHAQMIEMEYGHFRRLKQRIDSAPNQEVHFLKLETSGINGLNPYATALYEVHGPASKLYPTEEEYVLLFIKATTNGGKYEWWVEQMQYPYKPSTFQVPAAPVDDGHGHGHSH
jgi:hypothetical protein